LNSEYRILKEDFIIIQRVEVLCIWIYTYCFVVLQKCIMIIKITTVNRFFIVIDIYTAFVQRKYRAMRLMYIKQQIMEEIKYQCEVQL
jgi:hypothetical protein